MRFILMAGAILALWSCRHKAPDPVSSPENKKPADIPRVFQGYQDVTLDSTELKKFLPTYADRHEFGPGVLRFYRIRKYHAAWFTPEGRLKPQAEIFIERLKRADEEGLDAHDFRTQTLEKWKEKMKIPSEEEPKRDTLLIKNVDLLLTTEFHRYAADLSEGITRRQKDSIGWFIEAPGLRYDSLLNSVLSGPASQALYDSLEPQVLQYRSLKAWLKNYRELQQKGGWQKLTISRNKLKAGDTSAEVPKLRERLALSGDLRKGSANFFNPQIFDKSLELSVQAFQARNGLEPDGIVSGKTLEALNKPLEAQIRQILLNMERWRLLPHRQISNCIVVNLPAYHLYVFHNNKKVLEMKVIIGKEYKATPVFSDMLEYIVFSPYWNIPESILKEEILPDLLRDAGYISRHHMEAVSTLSDPPAVVPPSSVPWASARDKGFAYRLRQLPGEDNPLGGVKFIFPNNHSVYLHDTPAGHLFEKIDRTYSHGCIRIEKPAALAGLLLAGKPQWTEKTIREAMHKDKEQYVHIPPLPVYIVYFTNWVDDNGALQVRRDSYGLDLGITRAMRLSK